MKIGVCGVACEKCPRMVAGKCPSGDVGCIPKENKFCAIATCAFHKGVSICFECKEFPCETTKDEPNKLRLLPIHIRKNPELKEKAKHLKPS